MPREEEFSLGEQVRTALTFVCGTSGYGKLCKVPCHVCHTYGIWRSRGEGRFKVDWGMAVQATRRRSNFNGKGGGVLAICNTAVLKLCYWVL